MHDIVEAFNEDGNDVWHRVALQYQSRYSPFEVAHDPVFTLVDHAFWEDVYPCMPPAEIC
jgi:hypothetical protein